VRLRLLIDVTIEDVEVTQLGELIAEQPRTDVTISTENGTKHWFAGRFMGATPVHHDDPGNLD